MRAAQMPRRQVKVWRRWGQVGAAVSVAAVLVGCDGVAGPCVHTYREPLLQIVAGHDTQTGATIASVTIRNVRRDGIEQDLRLLLAGPSYGVEVQGDSFACRIPCGFATSGGSYILTVSARGTHVRIWDTTHVTESPRVNARPTTMAASGLLWPSVNDVDRV